MLCLNIFIIIILIKIGTVYEVLSCCVRSFVWVCVMFCLGIFGIMALCMVVFTAMSGYCCSYV